MKDVNHMMAIAAQYYEARRQQILTEWETMQTEAEKQAEEGSEMEEEWSVCFNN